MQKKILIIDDQRFYLQILRSALADGFLVDEASNGASGVKKAMDIMPDLILMDLEMPGMSGADATRFIKRNPATAHIPIIIITSSTDRNRLAEAFDAGADDFVKKPVITADLLSRVHSNLYKSQNIVPPNTKDFDVLFRLSQSLATSTDPYEILQLVVTELARSLDVKRCSIVSVNRDEQVGYVLASSADPAISCFRIALRLYPEIKEVLETGKPVVIDDAKNHPIMQAVSQEIAPLDINSLMVFPITLRCEIAGTLMLRTSGCERYFTDRTLNFCQIVANMAATALSSLGQNSSSPSGK